MIKQSQVQNASNSKKVKAQLQITRTSYPQSFITEHILKYHLTYANHNSKF